MSVRKLLAGSAKIKSVWGAAGLYRHRIFPSQIFYHYKKTKEIKYW